MGESSAYLRDQLAIVLRAIEGLDGVWRGQASITMAINLMNPDWRLPVFSWAWLLLLLL